MPKTTPKHLYTVTAKFNDEEKTVKGDDLNALLLELKPEQLYTDMFLTVVKGEATHERYLSLIQARMMFSDDLTREILINKIDFIFS